MNLRAIVPVLVMVFVATGGCSSPGGGATSSATGEGPRDRDFTLVIPSGTSNTMELYELNNGNYSRVVGITFQSTEQDPAVPVIPNPQITVYEGDTVRITVKNDNQLMHTFHLHGGLIPWEEDGVDYLTQLPIAPGEEHTYTFKAMKAGTYWYHCHVDGAHHIDFGMYGAFIVKERAPALKADREIVVLLDEMDNCHVHGNVDPVNPNTSEQNGAVFDKSGCTERFLQDYLAQNRIVTAAGASTPQAVKDAVCPGFVVQPGDPPEVVTAKKQAQAAFGCAGAHDHGTPPVQQNQRVWWPDTAPVYIPSYNTYLINGKAFPDTDVFAVKQGETVRFRLINAGNEWHAWHLHGHTMDVEYRDGYPLGTAAFKVDTLSIGPGERYDVFVKMDNPGFWMVHDQNGLATMNDDQHPGGMMTCLAYDGFHGYDAFAMQRALDCNTAALAILGGAHQHNMTDDHVLALLRGQGMSMG